MKKQLIILFVFLPFLAVSEEIKPINKDLRRFLNALEFVESSNNDKVIGDGGKAIGILQIHRIYFVDAQQFNSKLTKYEYNSCFNVKVAESVALSYFEKYESKALNTNDFETLSRLHNAGPNWRNKIKQTNNYWNRVKNQLDKK